MGNNKKWKNKGNNKKNKKGNKRPRELPPPAPPLSLGETAPAPELDEDADPGCLAVVDPNFLITLEDADSRCPAELNLNFVKILGGLITRGIITDRNSRLKTEESNKKSWDIGHTNPIVPEDLCWIMRHPGDKEEVKQYLNLAAASNYFDVPDPNLRPVKFYRGFYVIYPEGRLQEDPIFGRKPNFKKYVPLISKLAMGAVECHNFMTGLDLKFSEVKKANLFRHLYNLEVFFITFIATDKLSGNEVTCQSRVTCVFEYTEMWNADLKEDLVPIRTTLVESFHMVEDGFIK